MVLVFVWLYCYCLMQDSSFVKLICFRFFFFFFFQTFVSKVYRRSRLAAFTESNAYVISVFYSAVCLARYRLKPFPTVGSEVFSWYLKSSDGLIWCWEIANSCFFLSLFVCLFVGYLILEVRFIWLWLWHLIFSDLSGAYAGLRVQAAGSVKDFSRGDGCLRFFGKREWDFREACGKMSL